MVKIRPSPFYLSLCLHVRGIAHRSEFRRPAPLLAVARPVPALRDRADVAIAFSTVPSSFQTQTRSESQSGWPSPANAGKPPPSQLVAGALRRRLPPQISMPVRS